MSKQYTKFKIYPVKGEKEFYYVMIFKDRFTMRVTSMNMYGDPTRDVINTRAEAVTHSFYNAERRDKDGNWVKSDCIGALMFYEGGFGHGVVSHEIAHATNYAFLRRKIPFNLAKYSKNWKEIDEVYATILGYMTNQFWKKYNKSKGKKTLKERY